MKEIFARLFHRHSYDPSKWKEIGSVNVYDAENDLTPWLYTVGEKHQPRTIRAIRTTYTNTCLGCGELVTKQVSL